jgi:2'-5' RNA ligase
VTTSSRTRTIGVAIPIPEPYGSALQRVRESFGDPLARSIPTHITLLPPTEVMADDLDDIDKHLRTIAESEQPFDIHLRGTGTFRPVSPVVFVSVVLGISDCERIESRVRSGPLGRDLTFPYHPHVTVAHHLDDVLLDRAFTELSTFECDFEVDHFSLYVHEDENGWVPTRDFALTAAAGG